MYFKERIIWNSGMRREQRDTIDDVERLKPVAQESKKPKKLELEQNFLQHSFVWEELAAVEYLKYDESESAMK